MRSGYDTGVREGRALDTTGSAADRVRVVEDDPIGYDEPRATVFHGYGYRVLRFRIEEITSDLPAVLVPITAEVEDHDID